MRGNCTRLGEAELESFSRRIWCRNPLPNNTRLTRPVILAVALDCRTELSSATGLLLLLWRKNKSVYPIFSVGVLVFLMVTIKTCCFLARRQVTHLTC